MGAEGFFTAAEAARIAKVPRSTLDYWARTDLIVPSQRRARPRLYSFEDLRDVVVAERLRRQGAGVRDIRAALTYVRSIDGIERLTRANFGVSEGELVYASEERGIPPVAPHRAGQRIFEIDMSEILRAMDAQDAAPRRLEPQDRIVIDPGVRGGTPVIAGTRVPTRLIAELVGDDVQTEEILRLYPALAREDVDAALSWERSQAS